MNVKINVLKWAILICFAVASGCHKETYKDDPKELEAVDLGLPSGTLWASQNLLADRPWALGKTFRWGETQPGEASGEYCFLEDGKLTKYNFDEAQGVVDSRYILEPEDDAATVILGDKWRLPTIWEFEELRDSCHWKRERINGEVCYVVSSKVNDNSIIIPTHKPVGLFHGPIQEYGYWTNCVSSNDGDVLNGAWFWSNRELADMKRALSAFLRPVYAERSLVENVSIKTLDKPFPVGTKKQMAIEFSPVDALDKRIGWISDAENVVFIDKKGVITGLAPGVAKITAVSPPSNLKDEIELKVIDYIIPEKVDLGLPSGKLWADRNLGAVNVGDEGLFYVWGGTRAWASKNDISEVFNSDAFAGQASSGGQLSLKYDMAALSLGEGWHIPSREDFNELAANCDIGWVPENGGWRFTSKINGKEIVLMPAYHLWTSAYDQVYSSFNYAEAYCTATSSNASVEKVIAFQKVSSLEGMHIRPVFDP